eukprot:362437-Chlamydomonas_euryale.AAC.1
MHLAFPFATRVLFPPPLLAFPARPPGKQAVWAAAGDAVGGELQLLRHTAANLQPGVPGGGARALPHAAAHAAVRGSKRTGAPARPQGGTGGRCPHASTFCCACCCPGKQTRKCAGPIPRGKRGVVPARFRVLLRMLLSGEANTQVCRPDATGKGEAPAHLRTFAAPCSRWEKQMRGGAGPDRGQGATHNLRRPWCSGMGWLHAHACTHTGDAPATGSS